MGMAFRFTDMAGTLGTAVAAASCPACFPALASLGSALGLGVLSGYEGWMITTVLPLLAGVTMLVHGLGWISHRRWPLALLGMVGPAMVLAAAWLFFGQWWTAWLLYAGLAMMVGVSVWQLLRPATSRADAVACAQCRPS